MRGWDGVEPKRVDLDRVGLERTDYVDVDRTDFIDIDLAAGYGDVDTAHYADIAPADYRHGDPADCRDVDSVGYRDVGSVDYADVDAAGVDFDPADPDEFPDDVGDPPLARSPALGISRHWWQRSVLVLFAVALQVDLYANSGYSWHFFTDGASLLIGQHPPGEILPGGLHLYANYPQLQFGPLTLLVTVALRPFADGGWLIITWLMTLCGVGVLYLLEVIVRTVRPTVDDDYRATIFTVLVGGGSFVVSWELLAVHFGHLDDVLALLLITITALAVVYRAPIAAGVCIGLAADAKPWALVCAALLLIFTGRARWRALAAAGCVILVAWLPFVLADSHTLSAAKFAIVNVPASALRALGVHTPTTPSWDRIAQFAIGCTLGAIAVLRRRWEAVIALGIGARLVLDPSVYTYYTAGLALGVLLWDLTGYRRPMPILSVLCFVGITMAAFATKDAGLLGELRLWTVLIASAVMLFAPRVPDSSFLGAPVRVRPARGRT